MEHPRHWVHRTMLSYANVYDLHARTASQQRLKTLAETAHDSLRSLPLVGR